MFVSDWATEWLKKSWICYKDRRQRTMQKSKQDRNTKRMAFKTLKKKKLIIKTAYSKQQQMESRLSITFNALLFAFNEL